MKVFLGGTCNESTWRDLVIPMLNVEYFNPVVADWTPAHMNEELRQREICDICLYVITPEMTGTYSIAEVVDDSNKRPTKTIFVPLRYGGQAVFDEGQWRSLNAVARMVEGNGVAVFADIASAVMYINNLGASGNDRKEKCD